MARLANLFRTTTTAALLAAAMPQSSSAHQPGDFGQYLHGFSLGVPAAAPPPGIYFSNTMPIGIANTGYGQNDTTKVNAVIDIATIVWATGWKFLGADVVISAYQPGFWVGVYGPGVAPPFTGRTSFPTIHNTAVNPLTLSWNLGQGWFASAGFTAYIPDGTRYQGTLNPDYWTFEPNVAMSYLGDGWDLTARFIYDFNTASRGFTGPIGGFPGLMPFARGYKSGDQAYLDLTATKKFGRWELGPLAYFKWQTTSDQPGSGFSCAQLAATTANGFICGDQTDIAIGALVGYQFDTANLQVFLTRSVYTKDDYGGLSVWSRLSFKLWGPDASAKPLSVKY